MKNCVFTIVAKNYIGVAQVLAGSLKVQNPEVDFFIFVADEFDNTYDLRLLPESVIIARDTLNISVSSWIDMSFKYNLTEFCTAIKPKCFDYLFNNRSYEKVVYLDPDIYIFNSFDPIFQMLDNHSIVLTPHITIIRDIYNGELIEYGLMGNGLFNLGFCGLRRGKQSEKLLSWWHKKLTDQCFIDPYTNQFTDQKWMDVLSCFFNSDDLLVSRHLGMNVAPWNFFERKILSDQDTYMVSAREDNNERLYPLLFVHYSGYNYKELKNGNVIQNNITNLGKYPDIKILLNIYAKAIKGKALEFEKFIEEKYSYGHFDNGDNVKSFHRRLYRSLTNKGEVIERPFAIGRKTFHSRLVQLGMTKTGVKVNVDKVTKASVENFGSKLAIFNKLSRLSYRILGFERYLLLIRLLRPFSRYESQIHLLNKKYDTENITF